jgi:UDP-N-acetylmuramoyl-L-alanyl-D-glutamate--2,6-diaminopimelate ligase
MGRVVTELSDFAVITNDNPRSEKPESIISDIKRGIKKNNYSVIPDRKAAIRSAIAMAVKGDIVVIAGKGHENYQIIGNVIAHFDDREEARLCLK